ncbi:MAG: TRAP transporter small permease subunit [Pseudomonadota bacterium]
MVLLRKIDHALSVVERAVVIMLFTALVASIGINVLSRNIFHRSFQTLLEYAPSLVLWLALIGTTLGLRGNRHIRLELMLRFASPGVRRLAERASALFGMAVMGFLAVASFSFVKNEVAIFGAGGWTAVVFPIFFFLAWFRFLINLITPPERRETDSPGAAFDNPPDDVARG